MSICCACVLTWITVAAVIYFFYRKFSAKPTAISGDFKKDVVYLYQFPRPKTLPNVSPFCLKIETFLRINKINYECVFTTTGRSGQGLLPYVILNGEQIDDSELIIHKLNKHFNIKGLDARQEAMSHAVARMVDNHLYYINTKYKFLSEEGSQFCIELLKQIKLDEKLPPVIFNILATVFTAFLKNKKSRRLATSFGLFPDQDFNLLLRKDLDSITDIIGEQKFLFGDNPSTADCSVFGHLATTYYLPHSTHVKREIEQDYPIIRKYMENVRNTVFEKDFTS